jgi:hypothetical protein
MTQADDHDRLQQRTRDLQAEHEALESPPRTPKTQAEHREHREALSEHQADLRSHSHGEALGAPAETRPITVQILHRPDWHGEPYKVGDLFRLHRQSGGEKIEVTCGLQTHVFGWELRLEIAGSLHRSQVCRSQDEVLDTSEQWKAAIIEKGWA